MSPRVPLPDWYNQLDGTLKAAFAALERGVADRRSHFHHPVIATTGLDGRPRQRTMILRAFDRNMRQLRVHTDFRSEKIDEIARDPRISALFYDPGQKFQIRLEGHAQSHRADPLAQKAWQNAQRMSQACYGTSPAPGSIIPQGGAFSLPSTDDAAALAAGQAHFTAIVITIERLEWLYLAFEGHRRALFTWDAAGILHQSWLAP
jgi:pyridoxine/pyridoxamine 5'-phosphate oxidase